MLNITPLTPHPPPFIVKFTLGVLMVKMGIRQSVSWLIIKIYGGSWHNCDRTLTYICSSAGIV